MAAPTSLLIATPETVAARASAVAVRAAAEAVGTAFLLAGVVGSGIMGERLAGGNVAVALLANAIATGGILFALIAALAPVSGAHFNPVVTVAEAAAGRFPWREIGPYIVAQCIGAVGGVVLAHAMFGLPLIEASQHSRTGAGQWIAEVVATAGLLLMVRRCRNYTAPVTASVIAAYIVAAYWFTSSTSFANPAVTLARSLTDTFAGIRLADAPGFVVAQLLGLLIVIGASRVIDHRAATDDA